MFILDLKYTKTYKAGFFICFLVLSIFFIIIIPMYVRIIKSIGLLVVLNTICQMTIPSSSTPVTEQQDFKLNQSRETVFLLIKSDCCEFGRNPCRFCFES